MPMYEYYCGDCRTTFESLRAIALADAPIACPSCQSLTSQRVVSRFAAVSRGSNGESRTIASASNGCGTCSGGSCSACGHHH